MNRKQRRSAKKPKTSRPATMLDVNRAKKQVKQQAVNQTCAIFLRTLKDKEGYTTEDLQRLWDEVNYTSDSIERGYITFNDIFRSLREEDNIIFRKER